MELGLSSPRASRWRVPCTVYCERYTVHREPYTPLRSSGGWSSISPWRYHQDPATYLTSLLVRHQDALRNRRAVCPPKRTGVFGLAPRRDCRVSPLRLALRARSGQVPHGIDPEQGPPRRAASKDSSLWLSPRTSCARPADRGIRPPPPIWGRLCRPSLQSELGWR